MSRFSENIDEQKGGSRSIQSGAEVANLPCVEDARARLRSDYCSPMLAADEKSVFEGNMRDVKFKLAPTAGIEFRSPPKSAAIMTQPKQIGGNIGLLNFRMTLLRMHYDNQWFNHSIS